MNGILYLLGLCWSDTGATLEQHWTHHLAIQPKTKRNTSAVKVSKLSRI